PAQHELHDCRTDKRNSAGNRRSDSETPIGVLIEPQHLSCECHAECHQQKEYTEDPCELSRILVSAEQEDLCHVNQNDGHHEIRTPSMQGSDEPAESHLVVQSLKTVPRFSRRRYVNQREENSCNDL